jgi:hypothetical protein
MTEQQPGCKPRRAFSLAVVALLAAGCAGTPTATKEAATATVTAPPTAASTVTVTVTNTPTAASTAAAPAGLQPGERSYVNPLVRLPYGAILTSTERGEEKWVITGTPVTAVVAYFNGHLPIGEYLGDRAYCDGSDAPSLLSADDRPYWWAIWQWSDRVRTALIALESPTENNTNQTTTIKVIDASTPAC